MGDCRIETNDGTVKLHLSGDLTIDYADRLKSLLIRSMSVADRIEIHAASVASVDIPCLQLFCAAHKSAVGRNKSLTFLDVPSCLRHALRQAGFARVNGCIEGKNVACMWKEEKEYD